MLGDENPLGGRSAVYGIPCSGHDRCTAYLEEITAGSVGEDCDANSHLVRQLVHSMKLALYAWICCQRLRRSQGAVEADDDQGPAATIATWNLSKVVMRTGGREGWFCCGRCPVACGAPLCLGSLRSAEPGCAGVHEPPGPDSAGPGSTQRRSGAVHDGCRASGSTGPRARPRAT